MDDCGSLHRIEDDLADGALSTWVDEGVTAIEGYLAKHLAFLAYLDETSA